MKETQGNFRHQSLEPKNSGMKPTLQNWVIFMILVMLEKSGKVFPVRVVFWTVINLVIVMCTLFPHDFTCIFCCFSF